MLDVEGRRPEFYLTAEPDQSRVLPCAPESVGVARRLVAAVLDRWGLSELTDPAVLIVSELVTNAIVHAGARTCGASIRVVVSRAEDDRVQLAVTDLDRRPLTLVGETRPDQESGRGLALVAALSEDWGVNPRHWGKQVWAVLAA
ncbi:ATP-binding protein [Streptomyces sp. NPDC056549]|uniref:ATP-binding protein n=1 Tax=Streptomyces sp. NPDC056549 TaxID=3345864 RepID=UPI0036BF6117